MGIKITRLLEFNPLIYNHEQVWNVKRARVKYLYYKYLEF